MCVNARTAIQRDANKFGVSAILFTLKFFLDWRINGECNQLSAPVRGNSPTFMSAFYVRLVVCLAVDIYICIYVSPSIQNVFISSVIRTLAHTSYNKTTSTECFYMSHTCMIYAICYETSVVE